MRPDLPWNVAGIPPEAREAARAAARREGLSVGEWLTRRILRSFSEGGGEFDAVRDSWRDLSSYRDTTPPRSEAGYRDNATRNEMAYRDELPGRRATEDMLARVSRSEEDSDAAFRRMEDQMRQVARRLDATERSQSENNRAMSKAAAEINIATREQAQAFDQLGSSVMGLAERIDRIERTASNEGIRDAIKGLHQGLSRLADQVGQTATQSASQIATLAGNVESVAGKLGDVRRESEQALRGLEARAAQLNERVQTVERLAQTGAGDAQRASAALAQLNQIQENVARLEARTSDPLVDKRLQGIERTLSDIMTRLDASEHADAGKDDVEETLKTLQHRLEAADKNHREALAELRDAIANASNRLAAVETVPHPVTGGGAIPAFPPPQPHMGPAPGAPPMATPVFPPPPPQPAPPPAFDAPPFADNAALPPNVPPFQNAADPLLPPHPQAFEPPPLFSAEPLPAGQHDAFTEQPLPSSAPGDFLAAARRSAQAAAAQAEAERNARGFAGFAWGANATVAHADKSPRYGLIGALTALIVVAIAAGIMLNGRMSSPAQHASGLAALFSHDAAPAAQTPFVTTKAPAAPLPKAAQSAPSSPALAPLNPVGVREAPVHRVAEAPRPEHAAQAPASPAPAQASEPQHATSVSPLDRLTALANSGNAKAELVVGLRYLDGTGVPVNETEAAKWLGKAAQKGEAVAQYRLGTLYERGHGVPTDAAKAIRWYKLAAEAGNRKAMHNLAVAYAQGEGVQKDFAEAARWFSKAAALGLSDSEFNLAVLYERGLGVPQSLLDAYKWYAIAAAQGDAESKSRIGALATQLTADDRAAAQRSADMFKPAPLDKDANDAPDLDALVGG